MPDQLQLRGGTTAEHSTFTGAIKEVTVDTTKKTAVVHDGIAPGGFPLLRQDGSNSALALGSLGTPSLKWDANTGIYSPGEDELAVVTNGTRRLLLTGNSFLVGAPDANACNLQIGDGATGDRDVFIDLVGDTTYSDYGARFNRSAGPNGITYFAHRGTGAFSILTQEAGPITFSTTNTERLRLSGTGDFVFRGAGTTPGTDKAVFFSNAAPVNSMVLDSSGRLGIGNSIPGYKLDVTGPGTANGVTLNLSDVASVADSRHIQLTRSTSTAFLGIAGTATNDPFFISRSGTNSDFIINSTGKVGIGSTGPQGNLHIADATRANIIIKKTGLATIDNSTLSSNYDNIQLGAGGSFLSYNGETATADTHIGHNFYRHSDGNYKYKYNDELGNGDAAARIKFNTNVGATIFDRAAAGSANTNITFLESMRLDASGRLLVGTTSTSSTATIIAQGSNGGAAAPGIFRACHKTTPANDELFAYYLFGDSTHCDAAYIAAARDGGTWTSGTSHPTRLVFSVTENGLASPTERMRINNKGALKQSNTGSYNDATTVYNEFNVDNANSYVVMTRCTSATPLSEYIQDFRFSASAPNNTSARFWNCTDATAVRAYLASDGGLYNYSANDSNLSDRNAKKDISLAADTWDCIKEWEIVNYRYKDQPDDADLNLGVIAQQVAESCPEVITIFQEAKEATDDAPAQEERLGIKEQQMYWMAIKALQEAIARIETLETEVSALKGA